MKHRSLIRIVMQHSLPSSLRHAASFFEAVPRAQILAAAEAVEQNPTLETVEQAREIVHTAAHTGTRDSVIYAIGHCAAYTAASAWVALKTLQDLSPPADPGSGPPKTG